MKTLRAISLIFAAALFLFAGRAEAQDSFPVCLDLASTSNSTAVCADLSMMLVGSYGAVYGKMTSPDVAGGCDPVNGSAVLDGNRIKLSLTTSGGAVLERTNDTIYIELDPGTASGTFKSIGHMGSREAPGSPLSIVHISDEGTVSMANCPCQCQ